MSFCNLCLNGFERMRSTIKLLFLLVFLRSLVVLKIAPVQFPFRNPAAGNWTLMDRRSLFVRPTLTHFYGAIRKVFRYLCRHWCEGTPMWNLNRSLGVPIPLGICLRLAPDVLAIVASVRESLSIFTRGQSAPEIWPEWLRPDLSSAAQTLPCPDMERCPSYSSYKYGKETTETTGS